MSTSVVGRKDQYQICFVWRNADAFDVELTDYH